MTVADWFSQYTSQQVYTAIGLLSDVTPGTVAASKALVVDANKDLGDLRNLNCVNLDAGASGVAGTVDVFPATAAKGKLAITCANQTGNTTVTLNAEAMGQATNIGIPDPGTADVDVVLTAAAQTIAGIKTFSSGTIFPTVARTATADGTTTGTIAAAGALQFVTITSAGANDIVVLPPPTPGTIVVLAVAANGYELRTTNPATIGINGGTGAGAESAIGANTLAILICESATSWKGLQLGSDGTLAKVEVAA